MKRLAILIAGMFASLLVASAQSYVRARDGNYGKILYNWDGTFLRSGESKYGELLFYRDGTRIRTEGKYGKAVFTVEGSIPRPILIWISVLD